MRRLLLLLALAPLLVRAQLHVVQTPVAVHVAVNVDAPPVLTLPTDYLLVERVTEPAREHLGSFRVGPTTIHSESISQSIHVMTTEDGHILRTRLRDGREVDVFLTWDAATRAVLLETSTLPGTFGPGFDRITLRLASSGDERILGGGAQFTHVDLKGHRVPMLSEEQGVGRGDRPVTFWARMFKAQGTEYTSYAPIPFLLTTAGRALFLDQHDMAHLDLTRPDRIAIEVDASSVQLMAWQDDDPLRLLTHYTSVTGRMPRLPDWAFGTLLGLQGGRDRVDSLTRIMQAAGTEVAGLWVQDWVGRRTVRIGDRLNWSWQPDTTLYPHFDRWVDSLKQVGIRVLGYINPFLVTDGRLAAVARDNGYLVRDTSGAPYTFDASGFDAHILDLTNEAARDWMKRVIRTEMIDRGLSGWMADFAEWLPLEHVVLHDGSDPRGYHNRYTVDWARLNREAVREADVERDVLIFHRSGSGRSNQWAMAFWAGDQFVNFGENDGLPSAIAGILSAGMSGITLNHSDVGGYTAIKNGPVRHLRKRPVLKRWIEMNAFTPIFRTHEGLRPGDMVQVYSDDEIAAFFSRFSALHDSLRPLFIRLNEEAASRGWPVVRHPYLHFPDDPHVVSIRHQFMLGDSIWVAPALRRREGRPVDVYLPAGPWQHIFTGETIDGGRWLEVEAPAGRPAVFRRL